jgi:hypothetical protein
MAQKRSDLETVPLCRLHHDEQHRIGWPAFIRIYELDLAELLKALQEKPHIWITVEDIANWYWATYRDESFRLCPVEFSLRLAVSTAKQRCREILIDQLFTPKPEQVKTFEPDPSMFFE